MSRKEKKGIDYFSHDVHASYDRKLKLLKAKHGVSGYGVYWLLLEEIYKEGYFLPLSEDFELLFVSDHGLTEEFFEAFLKDCVRFGLFDPHCFEKFRSLTSKRIQANYLEAVKRRKSLMIDYDIWLLDIEDLPKKSKKKEDVDNNSLFDDINGDNVDIKDEDVDTEDPEPEPEPDDKKGEAKTELQKMNKNAKAVMPERYHTEEFAEAFNEWESQVRKKKKSSTSEKAYVRIFNKLNRFEYSVEQCIEVLNNSADGGWTDLYELKGEKVISKKGQSNGKKYVPNVPTDVVDLRSKM